MNISKKTNTCSKLAKETPEIDEKIVNKLTIRLQGIIQRKSASGSRTLPLVIFDKKVPFFIKIVVLRYFCAMPKLPFFKESRCCPKILDYTLGYYPHKKLVRFYCYLVVL